MKGCIGLALGEEESEENVPDVEKHMWKTGQEERELYMLGAEIETYVSADETVLGTVLSWMESEKQ